MTMRSCPRPAFMDDKLSYSVFDDFFWFVTAHTWTSLVADAGTSATVGDAAKGVITLTTAGTDNNEVLIRSTTEVVLLAAGKPCFVEAAISYTEANTDDANLFFGLASAAGANLMVDDGAGMRTSGSIVGIYKVDGGTVWKAYSRNGSTVTDTTSTTTAGGAQTLRVEVNEYSSTECTVSFLVDGLPLKDSNGLPISHRIAYSGGTEMNVVPLYVKAGGSNSETPTVDWVAFAQQR